MALLKKKKRQPARKFDINQTLVNTTYQPRPATGPVTTGDPLAIPVPDSLPKKRGVKWTWKKRLLLAFVIFLTPLLFIAGWDARNVSRASKKMFGSGDLVSLLNADQVKESNDERVNVLLVGYSVGDPGHAGAALTDSIMILSLSTSEASGYILSIPRDLYVSIPGYGSAKINEAYQAGGAQLLEQTITESFGIPIHYNVLIDYQSVRDTVNSLDGITVDIKSEDPRGLYDPNFLPKEGGALKLKNGKNKLDGENALKLTRARGSTYGSYGFARSDFTRTQHQRQVLAAIKEKIGWRLVLDPRVNSEFFDAVAANVKTNVKVGEVLTLYRLFNRVPDAELKSVSLHDFNKVNLYTGYQTPLGQSAVIPAAGIDDFTDIKQAIKKLNQ